MFVSGPPAAAPPSVPTASFEGEPEPEPDASGDSAGGGSDDIAGAPEREGVEGTLEHGEFGLDLHASTRALESGLWTVGLGDSVRTYSEHKCVRVEPGVIVHFDRTRPTPTIPNPT